MTRFTSILVANRGEIACRVIRTAKAQGYRTVAVYSEADAGAPHVQLADEAICIGPGPVNESYLVPDNILRAARASGAGAIHPGYGFLSENAAFARACERRWPGLYRPGSRGDPADGQQGRGQAPHDRGGRSLCARLRGGGPERCGTAGQGREHRDAADGEGRRRRRRARHAPGTRLGELPNAIRLARAEAESAFGCGELILEKAIIRPRHVEVQVFADSHGNTIHLGERDCSVQRRHQKVVEEAPCPVMTDFLRARMGDAAVAAAREHPLPRRRHGGIPAG